MKPFTSYSLLAAFAACGLAFGQQASTTPVGYVTLTSGNVPPNTDVFLSVPLEKPAEFQGLAASAAGNQLVVEQASFVANQYAQAAAPYVLKVESGAKSGLVALIASNTTNELTLSLQAGDSLEGMQSGDSVSIRPAWTVGNYLSAASLPAGVQLFAFSGSTSGIVVPPDLIYEFNGSDWEDTDTFELANNVVIYPGEGFVLRNPTLASVTGLVVSGEVSMSMHRLVVPSTPGVGQDLNFSFQSPVDQVIGQSGLGFTAGDQLLVWDNEAPGIIKAPTTILEFNGSSWEDTDTFEDVSNEFSLEAGKSYVFRRSASAPAGDVIWSSSPSYQN